MVLDLPVSNRLVYSRDGLGTTLNEDNVGGKSGLFLIPLYGRESSNVNCEH